MGKLILILSVLSLVFLGIGTAKYSGNAMFWLASGTQLYQIVRGVLVILLLAQLVTNPPRHLWARLISGSVALVVAIWTVQLTYAFVMPALDTLVFLGASVALLVTALESKTDPNIVINLTRHSHTS